MNHLKQLGIAALAAATLLISGCAQKPDAGLVYREARSNADSIQSCSAAISNVLRFSADGKQHAFQSSNEIHLTEKPFAIRSVQSSQNDGTASQQETYTVTQDSGLWFYVKTDGNWQKTGAQNLDTAPAAQIDILRLLNYVTGETFVRDTELDSKPVHKLELKFSNEVLRSPIETIATATGMSADSSTVVQTLLNGAPAVYGYGYIDTQTGQIVRIECGTADALNKVFGNIDGSGVQVQVEESTVSGNISNIGSEPAVILPADAAAASSVEASG